MDSRGGEGSRGYTWGGESVCEAFRWVSVTGQLSADRIEESPGDDSIGWGEPWGESSGASIGEGEHGSEEEVNERAVIWL